MTTNTATQTNPVTEASTTTSAPKAAVTECNGEWVKSVREQLKLTQQELCAKINVSQGLISQVEKGRTPVSKKLKSKLEALLSSNG